MPAYREPTRAEREAAEWLTLFDEPKVASAEIKRFQAWLAASDENRRAYAAVSATVDKAVAVLRQMPRPANDVHRPTSLGDARRQDRLIWVGVAAIALIAVLFMPAPLISPFAAATEYMTGVREVRTIALADRSRAQLSPLAQLHVAYGARERRLALEHGVAYFEATPDPRPFVVATVFGEIRATGAAFIVRIDQHEAVVTVMDGAVEALPRRGASLMARLASSDRPASIYAGQELALGQASGPATLSVSVAETRLAWRDGHIVFDHDRLGDAALEVTRFSGVRFQFADPSLTEIRLSGYFDGGDANAFVAALHANFAINAQPAGRELIVLRRN